MDEVEGNDRTADAFLVRGVAILSPDRLRNVYKPSNAIANTLKDGLAQVPAKVLLTATPLQDSLLELFGLVSAIGSGVDLERRIAEIYQRCRDPETIRSGFEPLQLGLAGEINEAHLYRLGHPS